MDVIRKQIWIEELESLALDSKHEKLIEFYKFFATMKISLQYELEFTEFLITIHNNIKKGNLRKDILMLSVLAAQNVNVLDKFLKEEKKRFNLDSIEPSSLCSFCIFKKRHWILEIINNVSEGKHFVNRKIFNTVIVLKCLDLTLNQFDLDKLTTISDNFEEFEDDNFFKQLVWELNKCIDLIHFCSSIKKDIDEKEVFNVFCNKNMLDTLSYFIHLEDSKNWSFVAEKLGEQDNKVSETNWDIKESHIFRDFIIFAALFDIENTYKKQPDLTSDMLIDLKEKLQGIEHSTSLLELLENIFAILFLKESQIDDGRPCVFKTSEVVVRFILYWLKDVSNELKVKNIFVVGSENNQRFLKLRKYIYDAFWRLELVTSVKTTVSVKSNILYYMLASPMSLLAMCLRNGNLIRAHQVVTIFSLEDTELAKELKFTEDMRRIRNDLEKISNTKKIHGSVENISSQSEKNSLDEIRNRVLETFSFEITRELEDKVDHNNPNFICHYSSTNEKFMNIIDILCTQPSIQKLKNIAFELINESNFLSVNIMSPYSDFCSNVMALYEKMLPSENLSICDLIASTDFLLDFEAHQQNQTFGNELSVLCDQFKNELITDEPGTFNVNHISHKTFIKITTHCGNYYQCRKENCGNLNFLGKFFNYLRAFSKVLYLEQNSSRLISKGKDTSFFELLNYNRSELMGQLLFENHLNPNDFEEYFTKMKLDFLYHLVGNCFPTINLHTEECVTDEELFPENNLYLPNHNIIKYIMRRNWLLSFILKEIYNINMDYDESRVQAFLNYRNLSTTKYLSHLFRDDNMLISLKHEICIQKIEKYIEEKIGEHEDTYNFQINTSSLETDQNLVENSLKSTDWEELFNVLNSIPEIQVKKNEEVRKLKDIIAVNIINDGFEPKFCRYVNFIEDKAVRLGTINSNFMKWSSELSLDIIKVEITNFEEHTKDDKNQLEFWAHTIELYESLSETLNLDKWSTCQNAIRDDVEGAFEKLILCNEVNKLLIFMSRHKIPEDHLKKVDEYYFTIALSKGNSLSDLHELLNSLPYDHSMSICNKLLRVATELDHRQFFLEYLTNNTKRVNFEQLQISLKILSTFTELEREHLMCLIDHPLKVIEVLLMNTKFDKLAVIMKAIRNEIPQFDSEEKNIAVEHIDKILRIYAEKALDFRVITESFPCILRTLDTKLIESMDSCIFEGLPFCMPQDVPSKDLWVQNNEVLECMCCENVIFSMFNRRHHCRRCGRVVCSSCSTRRMLVSFYGDIPVRVCKNCYEQTMQEIISSEKSETVSARSIQKDTWLLSNDEEHNRIVREEFSFDHAPSVSLCLSILKYHSYSVEYPMFLLNQCEGMLKVLHPSQQFVKEIDYLLVIRMLKSLATAAKMISQKCSFPQGVSTADRFLSQVDLLGLFTERGCLNLLPVSGKGYELDIDASALRRLRDKLLEKELWNTALEVSTKAGLDRTGVFAAWGMTLLKAGCLTKAREKFRRCLDIRGRYEFHRESTPEVESYDEENSTIYNLNKSSNEISERKPLTISPLLNEIMQVLETKTTVIDKRILNEISYSGISTSTLSMSTSPSYFARDPAISIFNKLRNLNHIEAGKYYFVVEKEIHSSYASNRPMVDTIFYNECIFYLRRYGSHQGLLEFYLKHGELDQALQYILDNNMNEDIFVEIYIKCLKEGLVNILQENIAKIDYTLELWKNYLRKLCRHLEKQKLLHCLYQLQLFMGDYIRAAMTCIIFYQEGTNNFSDLARKNQFLHKAEEHLRQMSEQEQWVEVAAVGELSATTGKNFEEKSLGNPSLVMKLDNENINSYLNTIWRQNEIASYLADCEAASMEPMQILGSILPEDSDVESQNEVPTLFGSNMDKVRLTILILVTSVELEQGFKIASRLIKEFKLRLGTVYCQTGKHLAKMQKYDEIIELVHCLRRNGGEDKTTSEICDQMLTLAVATLTKQKAPVTRVEELIKLIADKAFKVSAYIEAKQWKSAYFFAVRYKRISDIKMILREAELNNQPNIKALCMKVLQTHSSTKE